MKRDYPHNDAASSKRARYNGQGGAQGNYQPRPYHQPQPYNNQSRSHQQQRNTSSSTPQPDPTKTLESLLKALVANPDVTREALGEDALQSATNLSTALSSRINTATSSLDLFQPETVEKCDIPKHSSNLTSQKQFPLPALPPVPEGPYSRAPFTHKSTAHHDRTSAVGDLTYERLEFLGDAYLEVIATRLIYSRYPHLAAGRQAQIRERLVKNETLTSFSQAYRFQDKLQAQDISERGETGKGASGKILADVFEAYVAAVILSDPENGFRTAETWLTELWAPILLRDFGPVDGGGDPSKAFTAYNANAKQELQRKIVARDVKLEYLESKPMEQTKHVQRYFISLFLTGWGHEKLLLGSGEGQNKVEAGNRAAMDAMVGSRDVVEECARKLGVQREQRRAQNAQAADEKGDGS